MDQYFCLCSLCNIQILPCNCRDHLPLPAEQGDHLISCFRCRQERSCLLTGTRYLPQFQRPHLNLRDRLACDVRGKGILNERGVEVDVKEGRLTLPPSQYPGGASSPKSLGCTCYPPCPILRNGFGHRSGEMLVRCIGISTSRLPSTECSMRRSKIIG